MRENSAYHRKDLSYYGVIRARHQWHKSQVCCPIKGGCFDPGNAVYELMWKLLVPAFRSPDYEWSAEKWGDIAEGILFLGLGIVQFDTSHVNVNAATINVSWLAQLIDELGGWVWNVTVNFPFHMDVSSIQHLYSLAKNEAVGIHGMWPADSNWPRDALSTYNIEQ